MSGNQRVWPRVYAMKFPRSTESYKHQLSYHIGSISERAKQMVESRIHLTLTVPLKSKGNHFIPRISHQAKLVFKCGRRSGHW